MNKVICDVCGTAYPETEPRCPICDCVRTEGGQTSAANTEESGYTYVKGGRFSKSNVKKRLKAKQQQEENLRKQDLPRYENERNDEDEEFDEEEMESVSNRGLIIVLILLLAAIVAVASYLAVQFFRNPEIRDYNKSTSTTQNTPGQTSSTGDLQQPEDQEKLCTGLTVSLDSVAMNQVGQTVKLEDSIQVEPADTTDKLVFTSADERVATVSEEGVIIAVGNGKTVITIRCGNVVEELEVTCTIETEDPGTNDPGTDDPGTDDPGTNDPGTNDPGTDDPGTNDPGTNDPGTDDPGTNEPGTNDPGTDEPAQKKTYTLKMNGKNPKWKIGGRDNTADVSLVLGGTSYESGCTLTVVDSDGNNVDITWNIGNNSVVSYDANKGKFVAKGKGKTTLTATVDGVKFEVIIRVS